MIIDFGNLSIRSEFIRSMEVKGSTIKLWETNKTHKVKYASGRSARIAFKRAHDKWVVVPAPNWWEFWK